MEVWMYVSASSISFDRKAIDRSCLPLPLVPARETEFGWSEGRNIRFDYWFTGESAERMRTAATEVVAMAPDVVFVSTNPVVSAVVQVTRTIPIVFTWVSDSIGSGYVRNLAHPGGNITGF